MFESESTVIAEEYQENGRKATKKLGIKVSFSDVLNTR